MLIKDRRFTNNMTLRRVRVTFVTVEKKSIIYSECMSVALVNRHAHSCAILSSVACMCFHIVS